MGLLSILLLTPLTGALAVMLLPALAARRVALGVAAITGGLALMALTLFDASLATPQLFESHVWNPRLGTHLSLAVDGISLPMVLLTVVLAGVAILASTGTYERQRAYFALLLILESAILGVFMARDWAIFYVFWDMTLIPLFFLIDRWGGEDRHRAALNFVLYTMGGSVFMLVALLSLYDLLPHHTFDMTAFAEDGRHLPLHTQLVLFLGLLVGFGVKLPIVPLHGWLPLAHVEAPSPVSILLSGVLLKMGAYGLLRACEALPLAALALQNVLAGLALTGLIYGGLLAWRQNDLKSMVAYASVSHMGIVLLGIAGLNALSFYGAVMQMVAHGLIAALLFFLVGRLYERTHERDLARYSGLLVSAPRAALLVSFAFLAAVGLPGTLGFIAELHTIAGGFARWGGWLALVVAGALISAAYGLRVTQHVLSRHSQAPKAMTDFTPAETLIAGGLLGAVILLGLLPAPLLSLVGASIRQLADRLTP